MDLSLKQIVQTGDEIPEGNGDAFLFVLQPGVSDEMVVSRAYDQEYQERGLYARMVDTWEHIRSLKSANV